MYRALYAFRSPEPNSLPFSAGESFLIVERTNQHWWLASRCSSGDTGYVPASYLERIKVRGRGQGDVTSSCSALPGLGDVSCSWDM